MDRMQWRCPATRSMRDVTSSSAPPGWYPDPQGLPGVQRYWDGAAWTQHTHTGPIGIPSSTTAQPSGPPQPAATTRPPAPAGATGTTLASYGRRVGGWLIDWVLVGVVSSVVLLPAGGFFHTTSTSDANGLTTQQTSIGISGWGFVISAVLVVGYGTVMCGSRRGQTVGMMAVGVRAVDPLVGGPIGYGRAFGRAALEYALAVLLFIPWVIDMLWPLWDSRNQTLHDKASRTIVVHG